MIFGSSETGTFLRDFFAEAMRIRNILLGVHARVKIEREKWKCQFFLFLKNLHR